MTMEVEEQAASALDQRQTVELLRDLGRQSMQLVKQEIDLAKAEMSEKARVYGKNSAYIGAGGAVAYAGFLALVAAAIAGLTVALNIQMAWYHAIWLSALIVGVVVGVIGYVMIRKSINTIKTTSPEPQQTVQTLRENKEWLKHKAK